MLFRRRVVGVQRGRQQGGEGRLRGGGRGVGRGLVVLLVMVMVEVVVVAVMVVDGRPVVGDDGRGGGEDVGRRGRSGRRRVAASHAGVGGGAATRGQCGGRGTRQAVGQRLIVEEVGALVDEALDDCLVGAGGRQRVHGGEVGPHQGGPEADGQVLAGHQVQLAVLTHSGSTSEKMEFNEQITNPDVAFIL